MVNDNNHAINVKLPSYTVKSKSRHANYVSPTYGSNGEDANAGLPTQQGFSVPQIQLKNAESSKVEIKSSKPKSKQSSVVKTLTAPKQVSARRKRTPRSGRKNANKENQRPKEITARDKITIPPPPKKQNIQIVNSQLSISDQLIERLKIVTREKLILERKLNMKEKHIHSKDDTLIRVCKREQLAVNKLRYRLKQARTIETEKTSLIEQLFVEHKDDLVRNMQPKWDDGSRIIQKKADSLDIQLQKDDTEATKLVKEGHVFDKKTELEDFLEKWGASQYLNPPEDPKLQKELKMMKRKNELENQLLHEWQIDNWIYMFQYDKELQDKIRRQNRFAGLIFDDSLDLYHKGLNTNVKAQKEKEFTNNQENKQQVQAQPQQHLKNVVNITNQNGSKESVLDDQQFVNDIISKNENQQVVVGHDQYNISQPQQHVVNNTQSKSQLADELTKSQMDLQKLRDAAAAMEAAMKERNEKLKKRYMDQLNAYMCQMEKLQERIRDLEMENLQFKQSQLRMAQNAENEQYMIDSLYKYRKKLEDRELEIVRLRKALQQREHLKLKRSGQLNVFDMVNVDDIFDLKLKITDGSRTTDRKKRIHQKTSIKNKELSQLKEFEQMMTERPSTIHDPLYQSIQTKATSLNQSARATSQRPNVTTEYGSIAKEDTKMLIKPRRRPSSALGIIHVPNAEEDKKTSQNLKKEVSEFVNQQMSKSLADVPLCYDSDASEDIAPFDQRSHRESKSVLEKSIITMDSHHVPRKKKKRPPRPLSSIRRSQLSSSMRLPKKKAPFQQSDMLKVQSMIASTNAEQKVMRPSTASMGRRLKATRQLRSPSSSNSSNIGDTIVYGKSKPSKKMPRLRKRAKSSMA